MITVSSDPLICTNSLSIVWQIKVLGVEVPVPVPSTTFGDFSSAFSSAFNKTKALLMGLVRAK